MSFPSLISGLVLLFVLLVGNWVLMMAGTPNVATPFTQIVIALAMARFAINGRFGEWSGTIFSLRGGSWFQASQVAVRYLALTALWLIPMVLMTPSEEQMQSVMMMGPGAAGKLMAFGGLYLLAMMLTPPVFLIVAAGAESFGEMFSGEHWRRLFGQRLGDLFVIYAIYAGGVGMVVLLSIPFVILGFMMGQVAGVLTTAGSFCLLLGISANLLGRLCGFFACGDLGSSVASPTAVGLARRPAPSSIATPVASDAAPTATSVPLSGAAAPALALEDERPPLMDA